MSAIGSARKGRPPANYRYSDIADKVVEMGRHGQKTNAGWYRYIEGNRTLNRIPRSSV